MIVSGTGTLQLVSSAPASTLIVSQCTFTGNYGEIGGAIYTKDIASISIKNNKFSQNTARSYGGALAIYYSKNFFKDFPSTGAYDVNVVSNTFLSNIVNRNGENIATGGGAIAIGYTRTEFVFSSNIFNGNTANGYV